MRRTPIQIACLAFLAFTAAGYCLAADLTDADLKRMRQEKRVALVIGNAKYKNFAELDNPLNDARGVAEALGAASFDVTMKLDVSRDELRQTIDAFAGSAAQADVALFYYAGHATQVDWRNFIVPVSADLDAAKLASGLAGDNLAGEVAEEAIDLAEVLQKMAGADNRLNIVILDACRDNPFTAEALKISRSLSRSTGKTPIRVASGLAQTFAPAGTFLAYSTAPGQVASDGTGKNSPYSGALISALKVPGLKLEDVFKQVRNSVATTTRNEQIPWDNSSVFRDFYFRIPASAALANQRPKGEINTTFVSP